MFFKTLFILACCYEFVLALPIQTEEAKQADAVAEDGINGVQRADDVVIKLVDTNLEANRIIDAKDALEQAIAITDDDQHRCEYFVSFYKQKYKSADYSSFVYSDDKYYINSKAQYVKFGITVGSTTTNYLLFSHRRY